MKIKNSKTKVDRCSILHRSMYVSELGPPDFKKTTKTQTNCQFFRQLQIVFWSSNDASGHTYVSIEFKLASTLPVVTILTMGVLLTHQFAIYFRLKSWVRQNRRNIRRRNAILFQKTHRDVEKLDLRVRTLSEWSAFRVDGSVGSYKKWKRLECLAGRRWLLFLDRCKSHQPFRFKVEQRWIQLDEGYKYPRRGNRLDERVDCNDEDRRSKLSLCFWWLRSSCVALRRCVLSILWILSQFLV